MSEQRSATQPAGGRRNRLAGETSPYLLQHAGNPVDWYPWGPEAFEEARRRGVPIFLSVGYSTCYWCHVMERESFEHEPTADLMNERFVNIKLDREQRPDIDEIYMTAVQMLSGHGGWPMSVFLTPPGAEGEDDRGLKPFWGGTYFPREPRAGHPSFKQVLEGMSSAWATQREDVIAQANAATDAIRQHLGGAREPARLGGEQIASAVQRLMQIYDATHAGFGGAPKFPQPVFLEFLLDVLPRLEQSEQRAAMESAVRHTLDRMALGGLHDQVGGGFHRYSTDAQWLVPHFEKMLYDNAQLAALYARAAERFDDRFYERIARRTCAYVLHEMRPTGAGEPRAFYSAQDAEVNHREGQNYIWRREEVEAALSSDDASFAIEVYGLAQGANFRDPHHPEDEPANVLRLDARPEQLAQRLGMTTEDFLDRLDHVNATLYDARARRDQPGTDDKVIASWNGLMIAALARAGASIGAPEFIDAAADAASTILDAMRDGGGGLLRVMREGEAGTDGFLEDYAFFCRGLLALHAVRPEGDRWLAAAAELTAVANDRFGDETRGGHFDTLADRPDLIIRTRTTQDGATPSGQSVMIHNLIELFEATGERAHLDQAARAVASVSRAIAESPLAPVESTRALLRLMTIDPSSLGAHGMGADADRVDPEQPPTEDNAPPVQVFSNTEQAVVAANKPAEVELELRTSEGHHINARDPGVEGLVGLSVDITGGAGVRAVVDYPEGEPLEVEWAPQEARPRVHHGAVRLTVKLERTDEDWSGAPTLSVTCQACTDRSCLAPRRTALDIVITPAPSA